MATRKKSTKKRKSCRLSGEGDKTTLRKSTADKKNKGSLAKWTAGRANKKLTKKVSEKDCATIINAFVETVTDDVKNGTTVVVPKLATFVATKRKCHNPRTGGSMQVRTISTKLSKSFKDRVKGKK